MLWVMANLFIGLCLLIPIALISFIFPFPVVSRACFLIVNHLYRWCVSVDSFWMQKVIGIELIVVGESNSHAAPIVICNHQSWFDIPLIQDIISRRGPMVKFLVKQELVWVPIIGWICLVLNFPRLKRSNKSGDRKADFSIIEKTTKSHGKQGALLIFPEGTRFTKSKHLHQQSPYERLLKPKAGGLRIIKNNTDLETPLVDITIDYGAVKPNIWQCLRGKPRQIRITIEHFTLAELDNLEEWLNRRWHEKDAILNHTVSLLSR